MPAHRYAQKIAQQYAPSFEKIGEEIESIERIDGIKLNFASDAWLLMRPSGTEPLVRIYAEADSNEQLEAILDIGCAFADGSIAF